MTRPTTSNPQELFILAIILLMGFVLFLIGAMFWKPAVYQQAPEAALPAIHKDKKRMRWIFCWMIAGVVTSAGGWLLLVPYSWKAGDHILVPLAALLFILGALLMVISIAFRLTVQEDAAEETHASGMVPPHYVSYQNWASLLYSLHMIFSYVSWLLMGISLLLTQVLPSAIGWVGVVGGIICSLGFVAFRNGPFSPPIIAHVYAAVVGISIIMVHI